MRRMFPPVNFRTKVLAPMIAVMVVMLAMAVWFVDYRIQQQVEADARSALKTYDKLFRDPQIRRQAELQARFQSLANEPHYVSAFQKRDFVTTTNQLKLMLGDEGVVHTGVGFVLFSPNDEKPADAAEPMIQLGTNAAAIPATAFVAASALCVKHTLSPDGDPMAASTDIALVAGKLYNLSSIPAYSPEHIQFGVLTFGEEITTNLTEEYTNLTSNPIALVADGRIILSTLPTGADNAALTEICQQFATQADGEKVQRTTVGTHHYFCASRHFPSLKGDASFGYLLFSSYEPSANVLATQKSLLLASLIGIVLGSVIVWGFVHRATLPLHELRASAEAVGRGDFSRAVPVRTGDEFGELARAFNRMTGNIDQAQTELKQTVETLKSTQAQLIQSEKLSAVGEFVAGVAHELNNPLAAVMGFSELLRNAQVDEKYRRHLDLIFKSAQRCQRIVQSLLSFARRHQPERKLVLINPLIDDVLEMIAYQLRTSNVKVVKQFAPRLPLVLADGHQLQQVVLNIINNARQAIQAHQPAGTITVTTKAADAKIEIIIQDSGPGISPENLKKIFNPFFTTKEVGQGTGLGLSLCYGLIKEHGGNIVTSSPPGQGAIFTIELPATGDATGAELHAADTGVIPANPAEGAGRTILVVDDEEMLLELMREELTRHGYEVVTANNGETALRTAREKKFDVIFCDMKMPGLNGRQIYDQLRAQNPAARPPMVFVTGDIINEPLQRFLEQEQCHCLTKPFALSELSDTIKKILAGKNPVKP